MIRAFVFDLDGTLVETEELKALSYARAAVELRPDLVEADVVEAFKDFVGRSRQEVATGLVQRFGLEEAARSRMSEFGVKTPWQAYVRVRLRIYDALLSDRELILAHRYPHNIALLHELRGTGYQTALATMSYTEQAQRVLSILVIEDSPAGVAAALAAGIDVIAVTTELTRQKFRDTDLLDRSRVVEDPRSLPAVVRRRIEAPRQG